MAKKKVADHVLDRAITRGLALNRMKTSEVRAVRAVLARLESSLSEQLFSIDPSGTTRTVFQQARIEKLLRQTRETIRETYREVRARSTAGLVDIAKSEATWFLRTAETAVGTNIVGTQLSAQQLRTIAGDTLINGARSRDWWARQAGTVERAFADRVRTGMLRGETTGDIVRGIRGTRALDYTDGVMNVSRRQAEALVRSSVQAVANESRDQMFEENTDIIKGIQWVSTLDDRTTTICMALDGKVWSLPDYEPVDHDTEFPGPTAHWGCRSTQVPVFKSFAELSKKGSVPTPAGGRSDVRSMYERELRDLGMSKEQIDVAVMDARASMDGQVSSKLTFGDWLEGKPKSFQDEALGAGRAEMWRKGDISLSDLVDQKGRPLTLEQLKDL